MQYSAGYVSKICMQKPKISVKKKDHSLAIIKGLQTLCLLQEHGSQQAGKLPSEDSLVELTRELMCPHSSLLTMEDATNTSCLSQQ